MKVRVGGTSRLANGAVQASGRRSRTFSRRVPLRQSAGGRTGSSSAGSRAQIIRPVRSVWSETEQAGVLMKGNINEGEDGGVSIASRKTRAASTGRRVLPAQDGASLSTRSVDAEWQRWRPWKRTGGASCMSLARRRADEMKQALERLGRGGRRAREVRVED